MPTEMEYPAALAKMDHQLSDLADVLATTEDPTDAEAIMLRVDALLDLRVAMVKLHHHVGMQERT